MPEKHRPGAHLGPQHVRLLVGDELLPGPTCSRMPSWLASEPGRREQPGLVAEQVGDALLERPDGGVLAEHVVADGGVRHRLAHRGGWGAVRVSEQAGRRAPGQSSLSISATRNASSRLCWWFRRGSHTDS